MFPCRIVPPVEKPCLLALLDWYARNRLWFCCTASYRYGLHCSNQPSDLSALNPLGMASAAFVSFFLGQDFSGGFVRCKLLSIPCRRDYVLAQPAVAAVGCGIIYLMITLFTTILSLPFFEVNINAVDFLCFMMTGLVMSMVQGCFFASLTLLCANQSKGILVTMIVSFLMLLLALHTNSILVQPPYKNDAINPHYVEGAVRQIYLLLHNLNPTGQAAQLSVWDVPQPIYTGIYSFLLAVISSVVSCWGFENKDIQ